MRILIANYDEPFVDALQSCLWNYGHEAQVVCDGLDCLTALRDFAPDVLVLDQDLLWGGSAGVLAVMQDEPQFREIPVILIADNFTDCGSLAKAGVVALLRRPLLLSTLVQHISSADGVSPRRNRERIQAKLSHAT